MRLMIVEDQQVILQGISKMISSEIDVWIDTVMSGEEALQHISEAPAPDIILTDIVMPQMDGLTFIKLAKQRLPFCHFIILSGHESFTFAQEAIKLGVLDYLLKPVERHEIISKLNSIIKKRSHDQMVLNYQLLQCMRTLREGKKAKVSDMIPLPADRKGYMCFYLARKEADLNGVPGGAMPFELGENLRLYMQISYTSFADSSLKLPHGEDTYDLVDSAFAHCVWKYDNRFLPDCPEQEKEQDRICAMAALEQVNQAVRLVDPEKTMLAISFFFDEIVHHQGPAMSLRHYVRLALEQCSIGFKLTSFSLEEVWDESASKEVFLKVCHERLLDGLSPYAMTANLITCICKYIDEHCDGPLSHSTIAAMFFLSPNYLSSLFKRNMGITVSTYIRKRHMQVAKHLLLTTDLRVYEIAERLGYKDDEYFSTLFKEYYNVPPKAIRKSSNIKI